MKISQMAVQFLTDPSVQKDIATSPYKIIAHRFIVSAQIVSVQHYLAVSNCSNNIFSIK